ncbi:response regulator transcription factor [Gracilibacillus suaedae]|uniref:response regulator transcription factor n=1 Tax=Gracilibacillus suaedae TaxID=2820273 RepID=UPI001ABDA982|nr:response regulator [Gracilibacillus suaedae]
MNVFIIEDEYWALLELQTLLISYQLHHNIYFFDNGEDALDKLSEITPDLVITDITMPGIDGLQLVEQIKQFDHRIECVLLTVHDTFEYAKKGIQLGVAEYILKPIKKKALFNTIDQMLEKIRQNKQLEAEKQHWSISKLLFQSIKQNNNNVESFDNQPFLFVYILLGNWKAPVSQINDMETEEINDLFRADKQCWFLSIDEQRKVLLIPSENNLYMETTAINELYQYVKRFGQVHICTCIKSDQTSLHEVYQAVEKRMNKEKLFGESTFLNHYHQQHEKDIQSLWDTVRIMERKLRTYQFALIPEQIKKLIDKIQQKKIPQKQLFRFLADMYYAIIYKLQQSTSNVVNIDNIDEYFDQLDALVFYDQLENWLVDLMNHISRELSHKEIAPKHLIPKVKEWVEEAYSNNITFQQFAEEHHVSLSYLSREFKEQTNMTFSEYLTNVRIKKAKELFDSGVKKTVEVGALVGYNDPKHFRSVFKKITGKTPKSYREQ